MAEVVVSSVLRQLSIFLREEARLLGGLRDDVQLIRDELDQMKAFLKVAEAKESNDPGLQVWIRQVRDAAYDAEDVLDDFVSRFACNPSSGGFYDSVRKAFKAIKNLRVRHRVASEIQSIKSRIMNISESHQRYKSEYDGSSDRVSESVASMNTSWRYSRDDALLVEEAKLVGIEKPKQHLIHQLIDGLESQFKVISVVGMGGLGKTTLVKKVHEDPDVKSRFPIRAWLTVSQTFNFEELLRNLIRQLHKEINKPAPQMIQSMSSVELKECVKNFLQQQERYAIVFDDVWDMEFWNVIKFALPENCCGSRVILTTRIADVASTSCLESQGYVYKMEPLSSEESWTLFCNKVFRNNCCPAHLENVAQAILGKCEGLPLAIVAISGLLALKDVSRVDEWEMVRRSLGGELEGTGKLDRVKKILFLGYNDLSSQLKACLLYLSIYPEDYEIGCHRLIRLWIAERFVEWREGMVIEDVAWDYMRELTNRSLIQVTEVWYEGIPDTCRIHDILREVMISKSIEQNMVATLVTSAGQPARWPTEKVQRLVIHSGSNFHPNSNDKHLHSQETQHFFDHVRSLITFGSMKEQLSKTLLSEVLLYSSSKRLKVLDLRGAQMFEEIPKEVFNLFHLNYLCLSNTTVRTVSKSIGKLKNLEVLDLSRTKVRELPMEILKLQKLRHLWVYEYYLVDDGYRYHGFKIPSKIGGLLALQRLSMIDINAAVENEETISGLIVKEIGKLRELRLLSIINVRREDGKELCSSLANLTNLRELCVYSTEKGDEVIDLDHHHPSLSSSSMFLQSLRMLRLWGRLEKMPQWTMCLQSLARIDLLWSGLREDPLEFLQYLPNLVYLSLNRAYQGEGLCFRSRGFPKLKELWIERLEELRWMIVEEGAMPCLQELHLRHLPSVEELPSGLQHFTQLHKLQLANMSSKLVGRVENLSKESEGDYTCISHIPEIIISVWTDGGWRRRQLWGKKKK